MAATYLAAGDRAFVDECYEDAVQEYSKAIEAEPSATAYEARANVYLKLGKWVDACQDATKAIELADTEKTLAKAYVRKGIALFHLDEYESAMHVFQKGQQLVPNIGDVKTWMRKCQAELDDEATTQPASSAAPVAPPPAHAAPSAAPAVAPVPAAMATAAPSDGVAAVATAAGAGAAADALSPASPPLAPAAPPPQAGKYRHQWYQLRDRVVVDVYAKALPRERLHATTTDDHMRLVIVDEQGQEEWALDTQLYARIQPTASRIECLRSKVEVTLFKADAAVAWPTLQSSAAVAAPSYSMPSNPEASRVYPTSNQRNPKDWSKVESELTELEKKGELDDADPLSAFFKKIFAQGDEDQRRAMMKSFVESNGTVLSTNWNEVGVKKVECTPPDGVEVHKFEQ